MRELHRLRKRESEKQRMREIPSLRKKERETENAIVNLPEVVCNFLTAE